MSGYRNTDENSNYLLMSAGRGFRAKLVSGADLEHEFIVAEILLLEGPYLIESDEEDYAMRELPSDMDDQDNWFVFDIKSGVGEVFSWDYGEEHIEIIRLAEPIPMVLHCPNCREQHIDKPDPETGWTNNPPHRSHECQFCKWIWRPADIYTTGVERINTRGNNDSVPRPRAPIRFLPYYEDHLING